MGNRAYGYTRVSTNDQHNSLVAQRLAIESYHAQYLLKEDYEFVGTYQDRSKSGGTRFRDRNMGKKLDNVVYPGDAVIVSKLDRAFRNFRDMLEVVEGWQKRKIRFVMLDMQLDTSTPMGMLAMQMLGAFAEFERKRIAERTSEGLSVAVVNKWKKNWWPTSIPPIGFKYQIGTDGIRDLVPDLEYRKAFDVIKALREQGLSEEKIAKRLKKLNEEAGEMIYFNPRTGKEWTESTLEWYVRDKHKGYAYSDTPPKPSRERWLANQSPELRERYFELVRVNSARMRHDVQKHIILADAEDADLLVAPSYYKMPQLQYDPEKHGKLEEELEKILPKEPVYQPPPPPTPPTDPAELF